MSSTARTAMAVLAAAAAASFELLPALDDPYGVEIAIADAVRALVFIAVGLYAWNRRPGNAVGPFLLLIGFVGAISNVIFIEESDVAVTAGTLIVPLFTGPLALLLLYFPDGYAGARDRQLGVAAMVLTTAAWWLVVCFDSDPDILVGVGPETLHPVLLVLWMTSAAAIGSGVMLVLLRRYRAGSQPTRRILGPVYVAAAASTAVTAFTQPFALTMTEGSLTVLGLHWLWAVSFSIIPIAVLAGLLRTRVTRSNLARLVTELGGQLRPAELQRALVHALGDPSLEISLWDGESGWTDLEGTPRAPVVAGLGRASTTFGEGTRRIVLVHDPVLRHDEGLLESVGAAAELALRNSELEDELATQLEEVREARARIVRAGDEARRRIERDLHDGTQQTLVSLSIALQVLGAAIPPDELPRRDFETATRLVDAALDELRDLARGVYPAVLTDSGLGPAVHALARTAPLPVVVAEVPDGRFAPDAEAALYFVCREAVTNAAKHAKAERVSIAVRREDDLLQVEVCDDGIGGAVVEPQGGLAGLIDRMRALRGDLVVTSEPGRGSAVTAWLPVELEGT